MILYWSIRAGLDEDMNVRMSSDFLTIKYRLEYHHMPLSFLAFATILPCGVLIFGQKILAWIKQNRAC